MDQVRFGGMNRRVREGLSRDRIQTTDHLHNIGRRVVQGMHADDQNPNPNPNQD